jgi:DNA-directed RNA polymerase specialized sigma24 family protein
MIGARKVANRASMTYANGADFCRIFRNDMNHLYLLSFLLTGSQSLAEKCFVSGLEDSKKGSPVFREWAESWARRTVVQNAIRMIRPRPRTDSAAETRDSVDQAMPPEITATIELPPFERFVFVMAVLERYSDQECSLLLDCSRSDIAVARNRALELIGNSTDLSRRVIGRDSFVPSLSPTRSFDLPSEVAPPMAASA